MFHIQGSLVLPGTGFQSILLWVLLSFVGLWGRFPLQWLFHTLGYCLFQFFSWFPILCLGWSSPVLWFALFFRGACMHSCRASSFFLGLYSWVALWKAAFFFFLFCLATLISALFGLCSLSVLIFFFPTVIYRIFFLILGILYFWVLSCGSFHCCFFPSFFVVYVTLFYGCFCLGRLDATVVMLLMVLWSVSVFFFTWP